MAETSTKAPALGTHSYRPDIDGLRAIAVLAVVLYHAGTPFISGGFVGVDVFFVISGFLITSILKRQLDEKTFSIQQFYERRIRRILPAFFAMAVIVIGFGYWRMTPWDLKTIATSAKYALCSLGNVFFYRVTDGYFAQSVDAMPLAHTWSLGIEEQFYFFFPWMLVVLMRMEQLKKHMRFLMLGLSAALFGLCLWRMQINTSDCFYLLPFRAWELLLGATLVWWIPLCSTLKRRTVETLGILGLGLITLPFFFYNKTTFFPGFFALAPCLGAACIIAASAHRRTWVGTLISWRPLVGIGLISYSVYLWHWPLLAFEKYLALTQLEKISDGARLALGLSALPIGYLSWRFVEVPFRSERFKGWRLFTCWGVACATLLVCLLWIEKTNGFEQSMPTRVKKLMASTQPSNKNAPAFVANLPPRDDALYGDISQPAHMALWGDSHGEMLCEGLGEMAAKHHTSFVFYGRGGNMPLVGLRKLKPAWAGGNSPEKDQEYNTQVLERLTHNPQIKCVILIARWATYTEGLPEEMDAPLARVQICRPDGTPFTSVMEARLVFGNALKETVQTLQTAGKKVVIIYPVPEAPFAVNSTLARELLIGHDIETLQWSMQKLFTERQAPILPLLDSIPEGENLMRLQPHTLLIKNNCLVFMQGEKVFYNDTNHLSLEGVRYLTPLLEPLFP